MLKPNSYCIKLSGEVIESIGIVTRNLSAVLTCDDGEQPPAYAPPDPLGSVLFVFIPEEAEGDGVTHADQ